MELIIAQVISAMHKVQESFASLRLIWFLQYHNKGLYFSQKKIYER